MSRRQGRMVESGRDHALTVPVENVLSFRVQRHNLDHKESRPLTEVAARCGIHAQVMSAAQGQFWARSKGIGRENVSDGLWKKPSLVKTWCMRGTLHIVPKEDLDVFAGARRRVSTDRETQWMKYVGISYSDLDTVTHAIRDALEGKALTKSELMKEIGKHLRPKIADAVEIKLERTATPRFLRRSTLLRATERQREYLCFSQELAQIVENLSNARRI